MQAIGSMEAGPVDPSVLTSQDRHRSMTCAQDDSVLNCLDHFAAVRRFRGDDPRVMVQLARAGFLHYSRLSYIRLDRALITSLVERWRPETCTFHLRVGEMTITLQDVAVLLGLRIDGDAVTGGTGHDWQHLCMQHLGRAPQHMRGGSVKLTWLRESFPHLGPFATEIEIQQYTRAYILHQIGCTLFPDMSKNKVHLQWLPLLADLDACGTLSWGSAVLAYLYDEMTTVAYRGRSTIGGCLTLLQLWSWTRLSVGRPTLADLQLDGQQPLGCSVAHQLRDMGTVTNITKNSDVNKDANGSLFIDKKVTVVFVLGGPGSGKGTQCANIVEHYGFTHLSAGDLLRAEIKSGSENGTMIQTMIKEGKIVPSEVTIKLLQKAIMGSENDKFLIDGFPRNEENRAAFENVTRIEPEFVLFFECSEEEMGRRLLSRNQGRDDDNIETIRKRFKVFVESSIPVVEHYNSRGKVRKIDAGRPIGEVFEAVKEIFSQFSKN